jgi:hypothetical protein
MQAVEGLADVARRLQEMRARGEFKRASSATEVAGSGSSAV